MVLKDIVRAWRDPVFRASLSEAQRAQLPENPAGMIDLSGTALNAVAGGCGTGTGTSCGSGSSSECGCGDPTLIIHLVL